MKCSVFSSEEPVHLPIGRMEARESAVLLSFLQKNLYIFREGGGRLGNQLYWFASTYGIARHHDRKNLWGMKMKEHLFDLFPGKFSLLPVKSPGFPRVGHQPQRMPSYYLTNCSPKLRENEEYLAQRGHASLIPP